jgi:hypothetical protein
VRAVVGAIDSPVSGSTLREASRQPCHMLCFDIGVSLSRRGATCFNQDFLQSQHDIL